MYVSSMKTHSNSTRVQRRGNVGGLIVLVVLFVVVAAVGVFLVIWDGQAGQAQIDTDPPAGSVEGNLAQQANDENKVTSNFAPGIRIIVE